MNRLAYDAGMVSVLWRRDVLLFLRQRSRLVGALLPPLLLWLAIGAGIAPSFAGARGSIDYMEYFFPGVVLILMLQVSISATMSVIEDRRQGLLQGVLVAPGSRAALVLGKTFGAATVALLHSVAFMIIAPLAGFEYAGISWHVVVVVAALASLSMTSMGFMIAWVLDSIQGYHIVMNLLLFPLWILSGAMFPSEGLHPVMGALVRWNPLSYAMSGMRRGLYGGDVPSGAEPPWSGPVLDLVVLAVTSAVLLVGACWIASRRKRAA